MVFLKLFKKFLERFLKKNSINFSMTSPRDFSKKT